MTNNSREIVSSIHNYTLYFENDLNFLKEVCSNESAVYVIDRKVYELYRAHFHLLNADRVCLIDVIEDNKTLHYAETIYDAIIALQPTKKTAIISIGGGITQDLSGFVASTFYRGLKWIYVPTTLLAQADSCMGSKTSLNYKSYKNILGTFYPPHQVYISSAFTQTLAEEDYYSGLGEVIKLHTMGGVSTLSYLEDLLPKIHSRDLSVISDITKSSLDIKWTYMEGDEFDQGKRNLLNYGHCFGHAIETATNYRIPHGQAVIMGMILANYVSLSKGVLTSDLYERLSTVFFDLLKVPNDEWKKLDIAVLLGAMKQDKKRVGTGLPLIMMNTSFEFSKIIDLTEPEAIAALEYFITKF